MLTGNTVLINICSVKTDDLAQNLYMVQDNWIHGIIFRLQAVVEVSLKKRLTVASPSSVMATTISPFWAVVCLRTMT